MAFKQGEYLGNHFTPSEAESYQNHQNDDKNIMMLMIKWDWKDSLATSAIGWLADFEATKVWWSHCFTETGCTGCIPARWIH